MTQTLQTVVRKFEISDLLKGYNNSEKVGNFYCDLRNSLSDPIFSTPGNLIIINDTFRRGGYILELFRGDVDLIALELFSSWDGYIHQKRRQSHPLENKNGFDGLDITLSQDEKRIIEEILKLTKKYPSGQKGRL